MKMNKKFLNYIIMLFLIQMIVAGQAMSEERSYTTTGKINAIDKYNATIVIEVPVGKNGKLIVAGTLSQNAILEKAGKRVPLSDFNKGEQVTVK